MLEETDNLIRPQDFELRFFILQGFNRCSDVLRDEAKLQCVIKGMMNQATAADGGSSASRPYDGTALIAAAHLGHVETLQTLIDANASLDHANNLGWTALIEATVLGDGGERHTAVLNALVQAGADVNLARSGKTPLSLAKERGYGEMIELLEQAGAR